MNQTKSQKPQGPGCDVFDPGSLPYEIALQKILSTVSRPKKTKRIKLRKSLGRVLAQDIQSTMDVPNHTNSAMDGFAFDGRDLDEQGFAELTIVGTAYAGKPYTEAAQAGQAVKIMTGAIMPEGTDTVVMQEYVEMLENPQKIKITKAARAKQNVRNAGEDIRKSETVLSSGTRIGAAELGLIASMGLEKVTVFKKPRVAFFSNGDEVRKVGEPLEHGEVYDSNRHTLYAMFKSMCVKAIDLGVVGDDYDEIKAIIQRGNIKADMVVTSAGASVGEADYIYDIISELGQMSLWKLAIKPGRPLAFGELSKSVFFGLPGNPVSVMLTCVLCVKPSLEKLSGQTVVEPLKVRATTATDLRKRPGRSEYQRATAYRDENGNLLVNAQKYQGSGVLSSMAKGNCFVVLPLESSNIKAGEQVDIILFSELF